MALGNCLPHVSSKDNTHWCMAWGDSHISTTSAILKLKGQNKIKNEESPTLYLIPHGIPPSHVVPHIGPSSHVSPSTSHVSMETLDNTSTLIDHFSMEKNAKKYLRPAIDCWLCKPTARLELAIFWYQPMWCNTVCLEVRRVNHYATRAYLCACWDMKATILVYRQHRVRWIFLSFSRYQAHLPPPSPSLPFQLSSNRSYVNPPSRLMLWSKSWSILW